ncbi:DNA-binding protein [Limtongia smithiae]|uniref:DNA-binding protein n=1 Tax=Limtongia smithiae TaxID=1125753 RepID=UPI0034CF4182
MSRSSPSTTWSFSELLSAYADFLIVTIHTILYEREIYPKESFMLARKYSYPVRQCRHPEVCEWIRNAISACIEQLRSGGVAKISVVILSALSVPLERVVFDVISFPRISSQDHDSEEKINLVLSDVEEQFRACVVKLTYVSSTLEKLPEGCTYTVAIELVDDADAPNSTDSLWEPAASQSLELVNRNVLQDEPTVPAVRPLRNIQMGPVTFDIWIEQASGN